MLLKLPLDLLLGITLQLRSSDKLQLALTCKRFKDLILKQYLYETLEFDYDEEETEAIILHFRKNRSHGQQVKVLSFKLNHLSNQLFREIPLIFPNVVDFYDLSYEDTDEQKVRPAEVYNSFVKWKDTLESLDDQTHEKVSIIYELLEKNVFSRLTSLYMTRLRNDEERYLDLLACLRNAPVLRNLILVGYTITLQDMEAIHASCPLLTAFGLVSVVVVVDKDKSLPKGLVPALRLSNFSLNYSAICDEQCVFLTYLTQKYTNLIKLVINLDFSGCLLGPFFLNQDMPRMVSNPEYTARINELLTTCESYTNSGSEILANLPSTLKQLHIIAPRFQNTMTIFSKKCVNLTRVRFFDDSMACDNVFTFPEDVGIFNNLTLLKNLSVTLDPSLQRYQQAPASLSLTRLEIVIKSASPYDDMDIGWILSMFPSLTHLNIQCSGVRLVGYDIDPPKTYPKLTKILIGPSATHPKLLKFICNVAPNLKSLHSQIFGKFVKEIYERKYADQTIVTRPNKPELENGKSHYVVDLTGCFLNCFHLNIDLREKYDDERGDIILNLKNKSGTSAQFILSKNSKCIYFTGYNGRNPDEDIKTMVTVRYDNTKMLTINYTISIDLEKSQIQMNY